MLKENKFVNCCYEKLTDDKVILNVRVVIHTATYWGYLYDFESLEGYVLRLQYSSKHTSTFPFSTPSQKHY
jgi:hypothetical protein